MNLFSQFFGRTKSLSEADKLQAEQAQRYAQWSQATPEEITERVHQLVGEVYADYDGEITPELTFGSDLCDSLQFGEVVMLCEEVFALEIPDDDETEKHTETVGSWTNYIIGRLKEGTTSKS
jgi:acyl carrier protein